MKYLSISVSIPSRPPAPVGKPPRDPPQHHATGAGKEFGAPRLPLFADRANDGGSGGDEGRCFTTSEVCIGGREVGLKIDILYYFFLFVVYCTLHSIQ
jgi:hypothetical protein